MAKKSTKIDIQGVEVTFTQTHRKDFICITDIAKYKNAEAPRDIIKNWMRSKTTIELLGIWEKLNNPDFNQVEFDLFKNEAGYNHFVLSPQKWISSTNAIGLQSKSGRYGGTYAHIDIALEFASWVSVEFKFYLIKEFQRLKNEESKNLEWNIKRQLTKINYSIHTDAIKNNLIPKHLTNQQICFIYANVSQQVCLANLENLNAVFISENLPQSQRLVKLNQIAVNQMQILLQQGSSKFLQDNNSSGNG